MSNFSKSEMTGYSGYYQTVVLTDDQELTRTGPGTPCGEYMRRFWWPVAMVEQVTDLPLLIKVLGEELVLFRDLSGRLGLLHKHCSHRRASLEYGIPAEHGLRCCYHGWLFDIDGRILEVPGEPGNSTIPERVCHGAYPVIEHNGLVFAYLGPPEQKLPFLHLDTMSIADHDMVPYAIDYPCNWLQVAENPMDPFHSVFLHTRVTRAHFNPAWGTLPIVEWHPMKDDIGIFLTNARRWKDYMWVRTAEIFLPATAQPPDIYQNPDREKFFPRVGITKWTLPVDDTHCKIIAWRHFGDDLDLDGKGNRANVGLNKVDFVGQTGDERSYEEGQRMPGDYEAQVSQGTITKHEGEHRGNTDGGVARYRRMLRQAIRRLQDGIEPARPQINEDGHIPTMAGDVIVYCPGSEADHLDWQKQFANLVGQIVSETKFLSATERSHEIELRVKSALTGGDL